MKTLWKKYSGSWTLQQQMQAIAAGTWTGIPQPELYSWGSNNSGQLGINNQVNQSSPVQVGAEKNWAMISVDEQALAIKTDGTLWSWGRSNHGILGQNNVVYRSSPIQVGALTNWAFVNAGNQNSFAIKTNNTLWGWGVNSWGQLGLNDIVARSSPVQVGALTNWASVSGGFDFALFLKTDGTLWASGRNFNGQLGQNNRVDRSSPIQVGALTDWANITAGQNGRALAVKTNGTIWSWGLGTGGELGHNDTDTRSSPTQIGALTNWSQVSIGNSTFGTTVAVKTDGTLWAWGNNGTGVLGDNTVIAKSSPIQVGALTDWQQVSAGSQMWSAVKTNGTLWTCGANSVGQLGQNNVVLRSSPVQVGSLTTWNSVSSRASAVIAINAPTT